MKTEKMKTRGVLARVAPLVLGLFSGLAFAASGSEFERGFVHPPDAARPWVYWFWLNSNISSNGITADLEAMKRVGIGGVLIMEVDQGTPKGSAAFAGREWRGLFQHVCSEAHRLGLEVNMNNDAGWCGSGGPWITPDLAMQKLVWTQTNLAGPRHFEAPLPKPAAVANYYRDIVVLAFPTPADDARIENIQAKAAFVPERVRSISSFASLPADAVIKREQVANLTAHLSADGKLSWDVPAGNWTILRLGHTLTGKDNHPAPESGRGLESDKLSKVATEAMFEGLMGKIIADSKSLAGKTLVATHIDSWETGSQNWTPTFREDFRQLRGYDPLPLLPVVTGHVVESLEISERFLWDLRQTVSDLLIRNYAGRMRELARAHGLRLSIEAYDGVPCDEMTYAGQADEPMSEFWSWGYSTPYSCTEMASAAHVYGKRILGAEAFTATDGEKWLLHPAAIKALGDWAFCEGINRFVFHRYALQPWLNVEPGMSMGPWGLHYERTQTWWEQSKAWHEYLARCQFLLRQGLFVADVCYLQPEGSPQRFSVNLPGAGGNTPDRPGYNFDGCTPEVVLTRMSVKDGRLVLPDGMSYRLLVLPQVETMTPRLLSKISELVHSGATVIGSPPVKSPSLENYPACDAEVKRLADELWGAGIAGGENERGKERGGAPGSFERTSDTRTERKYGKGRVIFGGEFQPKRAADEPSALTQAKWIWYPEGNPVAAAPVGYRYFRRVINLETNRTVASARIVLTADNAFELWINGTRAGSGENFNELYSFDVRRLLKPGRNLIAIAAQNQSDQPNPASLIAALSIRFNDSSHLEVHSDARWEAAQAVKEHWNADFQPAEAWKPAMELGALGMQPWGVPGRTASPLYRYPEFSAIASVLAKLGVPPDFETDAHLRWIHRRDGSADLYFVSNPATNWIGASCAFRTSGKAPEIWDPATGAIRQQLIYEERAGRTFVPLWLEPAGSAFVVFRSKPSAPRVVAIKRNGRGILPEQGRASVEPPAIELLLDSKKKLAVQSWEPGLYEIETASGQPHTLDISAPTVPIELAGPWEVLFQPNRGGPAKITFETLADWSKHADGRVKYFSGAAIYTKTFTLPSGWPGKNHRVDLDLGEVAVLAQVKLNGEDLGTWWKPPYRAEVTRALRVGENQIQITVVNLWPNRMIGDEQLPEDSNHNPNGTLKEWPQWVLDGKKSPTGRFTFTSWRLWKKDSPLQPSGLLGPVKLVAARQLRVGD